MMYGPSTPRGARGRSSPITTSVTTSTTRCAAPELTPSAGLLINCNIATFLTGSALIPLGLTWWQAIICMNPPPSRDASNSCQALLWETSLLRVRSSLLQWLERITIVRINSIADKHILTVSVGFPVFSRAVWGVWGAQFVVWNRIFLSLGKFHAL